MTFLKIVRAIFYDDGKNSQHSQIKKIINMSLAVLIVVLFIISSAQLAGAKVNFATMRPYLSRIGQGYRLTFIIGIASFIVSLLFGIIAASAKNSKVLLFKYLANIYIEFIRGTPLLMQIMFFFYIVGTAWGIKNRIVAGIIVLSIFEGAYIAEIIRGSLLSISQGQLESAKAVGFSRYQTIRYVLVPQLIARTLPALTGQLASIIKDSSLLSVIAVIEMAQVFKEISALTLKLFDAYLLMGLLYLTITLPLSYLSKLLEKRFVYED